MYIDAGLEKFCCTDSLEVVCLKHCLYEGDNDMSVRVFDNSSCHKHYHGDNSGEDIDTSED
jgi:hypothetical protein